MKLMHYPLLIVIGFIISNQDTFGQSKFALSVMIAPFYGQTNSTVTVDMPDPNGSGAFTPQVFRSKASPKGYSVGLNGRYSFSQRWSASTGLWFNYASLNQSGTKSRSHNFSIPIIANFQAFEKKLSPYFSAGALWNFGMVGRATIPDFGTITFKSDRNTSRVSPLIGAGVIYHFTRQLSLVAQPTFSYAIPRSNINSHAYQLSLNVQLMFKL